MAELMHMFHYLQ